jgi:hypothetical protein
MKLFPEKSDVSVNDVQILYPKVEETTTQVAWAGYQ